MLPAHPLTPQALRLMWGLDPGAFLREFGVSQVVTGFVLPLYDEMPLAERHRFLERVPLLLRAEVHENGASRAFLVADAAVREGLPLALDAAGLLESEGFSYLESLPPLTGRESAYAALLAAWDACVVISRHGAPLPVLQVAYETRDSAVEAHWGGGAGAWAEGCAHHAALALARCARVAPDRGWDLALRSLDRMIQA